MTIVQFSCKIEAKYSKFNFLLSDTTYSEYPRYSNMKLNQKDLALLDVVNSARIKVRDQYNEEHFQAPELLQELLNVAQHIHEEPRHFKALEEQNICNVTKLMAACFVSPENTSKFRVNPSVYAQFVKKEPEKVIVIDAPNQQESSSHTLVFKKNPPHSNSNSNNNNNKYQNSNNEDKTKHNADFMGFTAASKLIKKDPKKQEKTNTDNKQAPKQIPKGGLNSLAMQITNATNPSLRKKFVPPFKKAEDKDAPEIEEKQMDPRYKNVDKNLIESIESQILENGKQIKWSDIAGLGFAKRTIHQMIVWPMLRPDIFTGLRAPPKGVLLFGPPGTGKTLIGKAIASESKSTFFSISASSLTSKWVGEGQKLVRVLFLVAQVRQPSVIFIDEIDSLLCARSENDQESSRRIKTEFLVQLDGAKGNPNDRILIIGATNRPQELDEAVRRRFVKRLYIPLPDKKGRMELIKTLAKPPEFQLSEADIERIGTLTKGYSGADLHALCSEASLIPLRNLTSESISQVNFSEVPVARLGDLEEGLKLVLPSVNSEELGDYESWNKTFGSYQLDKGSLQQ